MQQDILLQLKNELERNVRVAENDKKILIEEKVY